MSSPTDLKMQAKITALLRAARDAGFENVTLDMLPDSGIRASFSVARPVKEAQPVQNTLPVEDRWLTDEEENIAYVWSGLKVRERLAMNYLYEHRGEEIEYEAIKGASSNTQHSLEARGWMKIGDGMSWHLLPEGERIVRIVKSLPSY